MRVHAELSLKNKVKDARDVLNTELVNELLRIRRYSTVLPICAHCKRIRDATGGWRNALQYLGNHFEGKYTHTVCPTCAKKLYPELSIKRHWGIDEN